MASGGQDVNHLDELYEGRVPDILDNALVIVEFANGVRGLLDLCMFAEGGRFEQEITVVGDSGKYETTVPGSTVWWGPRNGDAAKEIPAPMHPDVPYPEFHMGSSFVEHLRFVDHVRSGTPPEVTAWDGVWSVAVGAAAHLSIDEGRPVRLEEFGISPAT
jgi:predicted dehydrogenase